MKKKYIIALEDRNVWSCGVPAKTLLLSDVSIFGTDLASVNTGIELTPYTEPDTEKVREEAFKNGYDTGYGTKVNEFYAQGLTDAWDAARNVVALSTVDRRKVFGSEYMYSILEKHTASEAIEKIRQYEQEKEEQIKVGDEVEGDEDGQRGVVIDSRFENSQVAVLTGNSKVYSWWSKCAIHKTGRHFPEISEVLEKMREV